MIPRGNGALADDLDSIIESGNVDEAKDFLNTNKSEFLKRNDLAREYKMIGDCLYQGSGEGAGDFKDANLARAYVVGKLYTGEHEEIIDVLSVLGEEGDSLVKGLVCFNMQRYADSLSAFRDAGLIDRFNNVLNIALSYSEIVNSDYSIDQVRDTLKFTLQDSMIANEILASAYANYRGDGKREESCLVNGMHYLGEAKGLTENPDSIKRISSKILLLNERLDFIRTVEVGENTSRLSLDLPNAKIPRLHENAVKLYEGSCLFAYNW